MKHVAKRIEGKGNKSLCCPDCNGQISAMFSRTSGKETKPVPNRRYCWKCDKMWKFTMVLE